MKRYILKKNLPAFDEGDIYYRIYTQQHTNMTDSQKYAIEKIFTKRRQEIGIENSLRGGK